MELTAKELFSKTMPFVWWKLLLRLSVTIFATFIVGWSIWSMFNGGQFGFLAVLGSVGISLIVHLVVSKYLGFLFRVGHVAVLVEAIKTGQIPDNQISYGRSIVKERFAASTAFFFLSKAVDASVKQLQAKLGRAIGGLLGHIPFLSKFSDKLLNSTLGYVDDCCIGWIFYGPKEQSATRGALDGIVLYFQNWKAIISAGVKTALWMMLFTIGIGILLTTVFVGIAIMAGGGLWVWISAVFGLLLAVSIKKAILDSWSMVRILHTYMTAAATMEVRSEMYDTLSQMSPAFGKLCNQARMEGENLNSSQNHGRAFSQNTNNSHTFCGECGASNSTATRFCGECGSKL